MRTHKTRPALAAAVAALALALTACGGGDDTADAKSTAPAGEKVRDTPPPSPASGGDMELDEPAMGKVAEDPGTVTYEILPVKVDVTTEAEAAKAISEPSKAKGMVLATARVTYTHKGGPALTDGSDVHDAATVFADGQRGSVLIGATEDAPGCEDPYDVDNWREGEAHTFCETYVVPANAKNIEVHWTEDEVDGEPYIWAFPNKTA
ncbi:lipoprotein [Streptomyces paradoxus]|uniref:Lipoprotein n=1 Tax=Streptomyces paradoxus TaxID=66375 RepID=A0A7W9TJ08_9ACTN|nr:hypothetical protein [Streptomyces paradoxus]MBB6080956.1 hypothetical protein [Streptomyces paradoxus]